MLSSIRRSSLARSAIDLARRGDDWLARIRRAASSKWKPRVLFQISNSLGYDAQEPVIRVLAERGRVRVSAAGGLERGVAPERIAELGGIGVSHHALQRSRHLRFDLIVLTDFQLARYWRSGPRMYLHHGSSFATRAKPYAFEVMESGVVRYLLALHETEVVRGQDRFGASFGKRAAVVGQPKLDTLLSLAAASADTIKSLGLDPARRTVIVLSHWTPTSLMQVCGEDVLRYLAARRDVNVLVTGHYLLWNSPSGGSVSTNWRERLAWIGDVPHMRLLPASENMAALMASADLAITDHTSSTLEYATLYRPIVLYRNPAHPFTEPDIDAQLRQSSSVFSGPEEFPAAFEEALATRGAERATRAILLDSCFRHLGDSGRRAAMAVEQLAWNGAFDEPEAR